MPRRERESANEMAKSYGVNRLEANLPISFIGTGKDLNVAIDNGLQRAADLLQMSVPDVKNRATILGGIEIGRSPGVAHPQPSELFADLLSGTKPELHGRACQLIKVSLGTSTPLSGPGRSSRLPSRSGGAR